MSDAATGFQPLSAGELSRWIVETARPQQRPFVAVGGRTSLAYGGRVTGDPTRISLNEFTQVVDYPARDMTITVGAGISIDALDEILRTENQQLPLDVPQSQRATLGGVLACNTSGPRRFGYGTLRDYVIGLRAVDGRGREFSSGGRVVKNVAGYDLCKPLIGSLGTLAIVTEVTLKLRPRPNACGMLWMTFPGYDDVDMALEAFVSSRTRPRSLDVLSPAAAGSIGRQLGIEVPHDAPALCLGFDGLTEEVHWQIQTAQSELEHFGALATVSFESHDTTAFWNASTEFGVCNDGALTCCTAVRPSGVLELLETCDRLQASSIAYAGNGIVISEAPESVVSAEDGRRFIEQLESAAEPFQGRTLVIECDPAWAGELSELAVPAAVRSLGGRIKQALDPDQLLAPGRIQYDLCTPHSTASENH